MVFLYGLGFVLFCVVAFGAPVWLLHIGRTMDRTFTLKNVPDMNDTDVRLTWIGIFSGVICGALSLFIVEWPWAIGIAFAIGPLAVALIFLVAWWAEEPIAHDPRHGNGSRRGTK